MTFEELKTRMELYRANRSHGRAPIPKDLCRAISTFLETNNVPRAELAKELKLSSGSMIRICGKANKRKAQKVDRNALPRPGHVVSHSSVTKKGEPFLKAKADGTITLFSPNGFKVEGLSLLQVEKFLKS